MRWFPPQAHRRRFVFKLEVIQPQRIRAPADQPQGGFVLAQVTGGNPRINQRRFFVIDPKPRAVGGFDDELVVAAFVGNDRPAPLHGEPIRFNALRLRAAWGERTALAKIKIYFAITAVKNFFVPVEIPRIAIAAPQSAFTPDGAIGSERG